MADPNIFFVDPLRERSTPLEFPDLVSLIKGANIRSMAISDGFFELGLSDEFNLRMQARDGFIHILLLSTLNKGDLPPVRFRILGDDESPTAVAVEKRVRSLRQLYALAFLINAGRSNEIADALEGNSNVDLETALLEERDYLLITAASEGTFWLTVRTRTKTAFRSLATIVPLFYDEGRQALLERIRLTTELQRLKVRRKRIDVNFAEADRFIKLVRKVEKIKNPEVRTKVEKALAESMTQLGKSPLFLPSPDEVDGPKTKK